MHIKKITILLVVLLALTGCKTATENTLSYFRNLGDSYADAQNYPKAIEFYQRLYDGDMAGIKASMRGIDMLLEQGLKIRVCLLPDGEDPDSFAKKHRDSELQEYLSKESKDFLLFKADILSKDAGNDPIKRASMVNEILKSISCVKDNIERAFYIKECAKLFDLSENDLNLNLRRFVWEKTKEQSRTAQQQAQQQAQAQTGVPTPDGPQQQDVPDLIETKKHADLTPQTDLLYEAEKELVQLILNYGNYVIYSLSQNNDNKVEALRIDQYVCNEMLIEGFFFHFTILQQVFEKYADWASYILKQEQIIRNFTQSNDSVSEFVINNLLLGEPKYSKKWKEKYDIDTHTIKNNLRVLQNHVQNLILTFKLRILEDESKNIQKLLVDKDLSDENQGLALQQINYINKSKNAISQRLNRVLSH